MSLIQYCSIVKTFWIEKIPLHSLLSSLNATKQFKKRLERISLPNAKEDESNKKISNQKKTNK